MKDLKVIFMGTPEFSVPVLEALIKNTNVIAVVTQPDKEVGRKKILTASPVKNTAINNEIKVLEIRKLKDEYQKIIELDPDIIITCAYGQILPKDLIYYPKYNTVNVHASLLPKLRGGAPIHRAIMNGDKKTGVTIMYTDPGMDSGEMISKQEVLIEDEDTYTTLSKKLSYLGADLLIKTLPFIIEANILGEKQNEDEVTFAKIITREDEKLDFNNTTLKLYNKIRALNEIGTYCMYDDKIMKVYSASIGNGKGNVPGKIINLYKNGIGISTIDGELIIEKIQFSGKKAIDVEDFLKGKNKNDLFDIKIK